ncbi:MAG: hypothetical protein AAB417_01345 [Patescibacteria group bacterium]
MVTVLKREKETTGSLLRRFSKKVQQSKILLKARSLNVRSRPKSKTKKKKDALRRVTKRKEYDRLRKLGKDV